jgi:hypothetical protein
MEASSAAESSVSVRYVPLLPVDEPTSQNFWNTSIPFNGFDGSSSAASTFDTSSMTVSAFDDSISSAFQRGSEYWVESTEPVPEPLDTNARQSSPLNAEAHQSSPLNAEARQSSPLNAEAHQSSPLNAELTKFVHPERSAMIQTDTKKSKDFKDPKDPKEQGNTDQYNVDSQFIDSSPFTEEEYCAVRCVCVSEVPLSKKHHEIQRLFSKCGQIIVIKKGSNKKTNTFYYIQFHRLSSAKMAIREFDNYIIDEYEPPISVKFADRNSPIIGYQNRTNGKFEMLCRHFDHKHRSCFYGDACAYVHAKKGSQLYIDAVKKSEEIEKIVNAKRTLPHKFTDTGSTDKRHKVRSPAAQEVVEARRMSLYGYDRQKDYPSISTISDRLPGATSVTSATSATNVTESSQEIKQQSVFIDIREINISKQIAEINELIAIRMSQILNRLFAGVCVKYRTPQAESIFTNTLTILKGKIVAIEENQALENMIKELKTKTEGDATSMITSFEEEIARNIKTIETSNSKILTYATNLIAIAPEIGSINYIADQMNDEVMIVLFSKGYRLKLK